MKYQFKKLPFNIDILVLSRDELKQMTPVTRFNIFEPSSSNFDPNGLFSTEIFGLVGSVDRNTLFSYISLHLPVLHPLVYDHIITTRSFYGDIIAGKKYAVYDPKIKDLVPTTEDEGSTGYSFFLTTLNKIKLEDKNSDLRKFKLAIIAKLGKPEFMLKEFLVIPAGLRDYTINKSGRPEEDEINDMYRKLMSLANSLSNVVITKDNVTTVDNIRYRIQEAVLDLYTHIVGLLDGKRKFIQGKWGSRAVLYGTRNVITPSLAKISDLDDPNNITIKHTTIGLYQYARGITPITMNRLHSVFISKLFSPDSNRAYLVNPVSMKTELVDVGIKDRDRWLTTDGLDDWLGTLAQEDSRSEPIMVGKHYMLLLHDDGKVITPIYSTDELPESFSEDNLRPITYYELLYIALLDTFDKYRGLVTRYPVINVGGIYPSKIYVKTTSTGIKRIIDLGYTKLIAVEYPNYKESYYNSLSPHYAFLAALGGDYDGDKVSFNILYTDDSIKEIDELMSKKEFYLSPDGRLIFTPETGTLDYVVTAMNSGVVYD